MKGYLKNRKATRTPSRAAGSARAISGDAADGYIKIKDRGAKDIIISGGENISSLEVEDVLPAPRCSRRQWSEARPQVGRDALRFRRGQAGAKVTEKEIAIIDARVSLISRRRARW